MKFKFKPNKKPDGAVICNGTKADHAEMARTTWREATCTGDDESNIADLIADLGHLCDRDGLDFEAAIESALINWRAER